MSDIRLRCDTYSNPAVMDINIKIAGFGESDTISEELTAIFYDKHKEDIEKIKELYQAERLALKNRVELVKNLRDNEMIEFRKEVKENHPELFI